MERNRLLARTSIATPFVGIALLVISWGQHPSPVASVLLALVHVLLVMVSVSHAEVIAHRVGEPFGTLVLALAVTAIEVSLIVTLMASEGDKAQTLARDTVFAAVMIVCNIVVGLSIIVNARRNHIVMFSEQGANALLGTVMTVAVLALVMPNFTTSTVGGTFSGAQLAFSAVVSAGIYGVFVFVQTIRHRWMFLSADARHDETSEIGHTHARAARDGLYESLWLRVTLLVVSLIGVVGLAKTLSPRIEEVVTWVGAPQSFVGVIIALLVLLPESITALRAAAKGSFQTSLNLSLGSALASIGLTIPAIAVASIWLDGPMTLGLEGKEIVLLALTAVVSGLTFGSGRATVLQGVQHLAIGITFVFLAAVP